LATSLQSLPYHRSRYVWPLWVSSARRTLASSRTGTRTSGHLVRRLVAWQVHTGVDTRSARSQICWCHILLQPDSAKAGTGWHLQDTVILCITCLRNKQKKGGGTEDKILTINTRITQHCSAMALRQTYVWILQDGTRRYWNRTYDHLEGTVTICYVATDTPLFCVNFLQ